MNQEMIEALLNWLMWISLDALLLIAAACAYVGLRRLSRVLYARLRPVAIGVFAVAAIFATCEAQKRLLRDGGTGQQVVVTQEEIAQGWRLESVVTNDAVSDAIPDGITSSFNWHKRGTFGEWARLDLGDFAFPLGTNDGAVTSFSVFNDGRIRPTPRDAAREICAVGVPMLAMQWASRFWVGDAARSASGPYQGKILTWENFFLNADTNAPVNAQIELVANGDFVTRSNDVERIYRRVEPFDWDGDGLENTVDPDPLVAGPDAHGTNAEWYNVVCSNVLEAVEGDGSAGTPLPTLSWIDGVNTNAYYFVDIVTTNCLAPIYFTGDRESRLGNPVVVARAFETNHVPLLIGITYAVTSTVPFTVSIPDDGFTSVITNGVSNYAVQWPLEFTVVPDGTGYRANVGPYDPGCEFFWDLPTRSVTCNYTTDGGWIGFNCHGDGFCECDGCSVSGVAMLEEASFDLPDVWCGCWHYDPLNPEIGLVFTNLPYVAVSFDNHVVFYEDAYTNAPNDVVAKHSTNTTLTVFAYGGDAGGMLYVSAQKIEKLVRVGGKSISFPYTAFVPPQSGVSFSIEYEAAECSDSINDISVSAMIVSCDGGSSVSDSDTTTSVKVRITACRQFPSFRRRHRYGICEDIWCEWFPKSAVIDWAHSGEGHWAEIWPTYRRFVFPQGPCTPVLTASHGDASYDIDLTCVAPNSIDAKFDNYMVATPPTAGKSGLVGMLLQLTLMPTNVSFEGLYVEEIPTTTGTHTGYFNVPAFSNWWHHTRANGAGNWHLTGIDNIFAVDEAVMQEECLPPWSNGEITWQIPVEWAFSSTNTAGTGTLFYSAVQQFLIDTEGTVSVEKFKYILSRSTNDVFSLKKRMSK